MLGEQITSGQLTNSERMTMQIHDMMITMISNLGITTKYIDRHPTTTMTNNPPPGCHPSPPLVLSCKQRIIALSKARKVNKHICPWT